MSQALIHALKTIEEGLADRRALEPSSIGGMDRKLAALYLIEAAARLALNAPGANGSPLAASGVYWRAAKVLSALDKYLHENDPAEASRIQQMHGRIVPPQSIAADAMTENDAGEPCFAETETEAPDEAAFWLRYNADKAEHMTANQWGKWVDALPVSEFIAMIRIGLRDRPAQEATR